VPAYKQAGCVRHSGQLTQFIFLNHFTVSSNATFTDKTVILYDVQILFTRQNLLFGKQKDIINNPTMELLNYARWNFQLQYKS